MYSPDGPACAATTASARSTTTSRHYHLDLEPLADLGEIAEDDPGLDEDTALVERTSTSPAGAAGRSGTKMDRRDQRGSPFAGAGIPVRSTE